jgi:hypothetical protein
MQTKICDLHNRLDLSWMVVGDFNECMWCFEHFSSTHRDEPQMTTFRDTLKVCDLVDLGFCGVPHTYDNKLSGRANVKVRLDHVSASHS